ncbi:MAG: transposase [Syntrophorhabdaceae bacterium]
MRRFLTGYVASFNKRHKRTGHLFQNRYKSIVCDEEVYFKELVRYIHLNPIRAGIVSTIDDLDVFAYSGHAALIGKTDSPWQDVRYVLEMSAIITTKARKAYRTYIESALNQDRRDDLSAGTLVKSLQGWTDIKDTEHRAKGDQRILGGSDFVMKILKQAENAYDRKFIIKNKGYTLDSVADIIAAMYDIPTNDILSRGRHAPKVEARSLFCYIASHDLATSVTDIARLIGMTPSAITYAVERGKYIAQEKHFKL